MALYMWAIDKTLVTLLVGPVVGLLISNGIVSNACSTEVQAAFTETLVTVLTLGGLAIGAVHHTALRKIEVGTEEAPEESLAKLSRFAGWAAALKAFYEKFAYSKPPASLPTETERPQQDSI